MELSKCLGCMDNLQAYPCPHCGYDPAQEPRPEYALPRETILAGKYLVGRVLGQGGFGITYIGWDIALERKVAIKEYYPSGQVNRSPGSRSLTWYTNEPALQAREDGMKMFLKEARKMVKADSIPGVVRVLDLFQENDTAYIVMDFVSGETLKARLQKTGPMTWAQAAPIFRPAIRAMEQVHQAGLIHRDLSPDNLMLTADGGVKILDLGAAKDLNLNSGASSMQVAKSGFSPLEQYTQRGGSGPWTDVYSMAATIYYTLTGKLPPNAVDRMEEDTIDWTSPELGSLPKAALKALQAAMSVSAKKRTQSMQELEEGLFRAERPKREEKPRKNRKSIRKQWLLPAAMLLCLAGMVVGIAGLPKSKGTVQEPLPEATQSQEPTQSSDVGSPIGTYLSQDGAYSLIVAEKGECYLQLVNSGVTYSGKYSLDGATLQMRFTAGPQEAKGIPVADGLVVSCDYFSPKVFVFQTAKSTHDQYTSTDGKYSLTLKTDGSCYLTFNDNQHQYVGSYSSDGTSFELYFAEGPGVVTATQVADRLLLTCDLFTQKPFKKI